MNSVLKLATSDGSAASQVKPLAVALGEQQLAVPEIHKAEI